jgi:hypothetical protein
MNVATELFRLVLFIIIVGLLSISFGCGSEKDEGSDGASELYGLWTQDTSCGYGIEIEQAGFHIFYMCFVDSQTAQLSVKTVKFDNEEGKLSGVVISTTCEKDLGTNFSIEYSIEDGKMSLSTGKAIIANLIKQVESSGSDDALTILYGCGQTGEFIPTQIYK